MLQGRPRLGVAIGCVAVACAIGIASIVVRAADDATAVATGTTAAAAGIPYWQAPALPAAVIRGGAIPAGWQPQAVPYRGVGPDGRLLTVYVAPTYVFTYQAGPPVAVAPAVNRRPPVAVAAASGWNYQAQGATVVPVALPPATVTRYQPPPYRFPPDARALSGTPIVPPQTPLPGPPPPPVAQPPTGFVAAPVDPPPLAAPPAQWVPSNVAPPGGAAPQSASGWAAAPAMAAVAVPIAAAAAASNPAPPPPLPPPVAPIPTGLPPAAATPVSVARTAPPPPSTAAANTHFWRVVGVHDGDTVTCIDESNQQQKIRLAEIDAPEVSQDFGTVSREALAGMVFGKTIQVVDDGRDRYGRWIGRLFVDGLDVNRQMVATGMAWHYAAYSKDPSLATLQSQAQAQYLGLWSQPNPVPPWEYRKNGKKKSA